MPPRPRWARFRRAIVASLATCLLIGPAASAAPPQRSAVVPGTPPSVLVRFQPGVVPDEAERIADDHGLRLMGPVEGTGFWLFSSPTGSVDTVAGRLAADGRVETAEPNHVRHAAAVPNDPRFAVSQTANANLVRLPEAWDLTTGSDDLTLAVVDSGVNAAHPDLAGRLLPGRDFVNDDDDPDDDLGHGTQVTTVAAATGNDGRGMAGAAWRGKVLPVKVIDAAGKTTDADVAAGIRWAVDRGADVINLSFGGIVAPTTIIREAVQYARDRDVLVVAAAGNTGRTNPIYPAALEGVLAVAATDSTGRLASFSDSGPWVDVAAPGVDVLVGSREGGYRLAEGTSFAAPLVSGVALLARTRHPNETADQIAERIRMGATDTGPLGPDDIYGAGVVDALGALTGTTRRLPADPALMAHEPDNTPDRASTLVLDGRDTAFFAPERDVDWYAVDISVARLHTFTVEPTAGVSGFDPVLAIYDPQLQKLAERGGDRNGRIDFALFTATPGRYHLRVQSRTPTAAAGPYGVRVGSTLGAAQVHFTTKYRGYNDPSYGGSAVVVGNLTGGATGDVLFSRPGRPTGVDHNTLVLWPQPTTGGGSVTIPTGAGSTASLGLALADVDDDGDDDVAVATRAGLEIHHRTQGTLQGRTVISGTGPVLQVEAGDLDGDARPDLVVARDGGGISVLVHDGNATFDAPRSLTTTRVAEIEVADLEGDGRAEIVALECNPACRTVAVYRSRPDGGFDRTTTRISPDAPCGEHGGALGVGNVAGDTRLDVFASCAGVRPVFLLALDATGTLQPRAPIEMWSEEAAVALEPGDIDRDGRDEILTLHDDQEYVYAVWLTPDGAAGNGFDLAPVMRDWHGPKGLAVGDLDGDGGDDVAVAGWTTGVDTLTIKPVIPTPIAGGQQWVRDTSPADGTTGVTADVVPTLRFAPRVDPHSATPATVRLSDAHSGTIIPASVTYDGSTNTVVIGPLAPLRSGGTYQVTVAGLQSETGTVMADIQSFRFAVRHAPSPPDPQPPGTPDPTHTTTATRSGYWMLDGAGTVYHFGDTATLGDGVAGSVDLEPTPTGKGYWILHRNGIVSDFGDADHHGHADPSKLAREEFPASLSATPSGRGYWIFTNRGRAIAFGDAAHLGDMSAVTLNGPVLGSVATPSGRGYYMVASDGGIFAFGDAAFAGSMGDKKLNAPVQSLVPDADGTGYWLVASDGGIFAFDAPFRGSMGATKLNKPVVGMVRYGDGYLMVGADGGIFNFSTSPFAGSLGDKPPASPVVAVAALP